MFEVIHGDCLEVLKTLPDNSVEAIVTDPPAGIAFMGKSWDKDKGGREHWIAWMSDVAAECLRVIKPGGHALVWAIPRTSHWTGTAWENAGWDCRDKIFHCFGSGFPKSLCIDKAIDKAAGAEREVVGVSPRHSVGKLGKHGASINLCETGLNLDGTTPLTAPATPSAKQWEGWGTALKPAVEEWWLFRKPLAENTVAANVLEHGTGALNIDGCRVGVDASDVNHRTNPSRGNNGANSVFGVGGRNGNLCQSGRFPAHLIHDGSEEVLACFPETTSGGGNKASRNPGMWAWKKSLDDIREPDSGSAARFFYCAKASKRDRDEGLDGFESKKIETMNGYKSPPEGRTADKNGGVKANHHPTVKATELMRYLCRLITPPGGTILDPFCGSGSTGKGATLERFNFIGIEQDADYVEIARARIAYVLEAERQLSLLGDRLP